MKHNLKTLQIYYKKYTNEAEEYLDKLIKELEHLKQQWNAGILSTGFSRGDSHACPALV